MLPVTAIKTNTKANIKARKFFELAGFIFPYSRALRSRPIQGDVRLDPSAVEPAPANQQHHK